MRRAKYSHNQRTTETELAMALDLATRPRPLALAFSCCCGAALLALLWSPGASAQDAAATANGAGAQLERVTVTGSNIRRADAETPSPVQVISADELRKSGYTSVAEVLAGLSAGNMGALNQANASAFAAGAAGVSLRGLTVGATLVLVDGHRMASYPLPDDGQRDFVDIASIPLAAVERIEVLKDGASAVYGSDAIAGVVNVILKKSFQGTALGAEVGATARGDGTLQHYTLSHGVGDLQADGYNAYAMLELRQRRPVLLKDRDDLRISDWSAFGGTPDIFASNRTPNLAGNDALQLQPDTRNVNLLGRFTRQLAGGWQFNVQGSLLNSQATQVGVLNDVSAGQISFAWGPANAQQPLPNPLGNPYVFLQADGATPFTGSLKALGAQTQRSDTSSYRWVLQLLGDWGEWSLDATLGLTGAITRLKSENFLSISGFQAALASGAYVPGQATLSAALRAQIAPLGESTSTNRLNFINLRATRDLLDLAGGPLALGTGLELTQRTLNEAFPARFNSGDQYSPIYSFAEGSQRIIAAYAELVAPLAKALEVDAAVRLDHYDSYGNSVTPKLGFKYGAAQGVTLRGTYAQGFRAPNPAETGKAGSTSGVLNPLYDPLLCANGNAASAIDPSQCGIFLTEQQLANAQLKPERSSSYTLGLILEPSEVFNLSLDYYDITLRDQIISVGLLGQTQLNNPTTYGAVIFRAAPDPSVPGATVGPILYETYPFLNASETHTSGLDIDLRAKFKLADGSRLTANLNLTRMLRYDMRYGGASYAFVGTHGPGFVSGDTGTPRDHLQASLGWERGPWALSATLQAVSGINVLDPTQSPNTCDAALSGTFPNGVPAQAQRWCQVPGFATLNLYGQYSLTRQLTVHGAITNALDRRAPYDLQTFGSTGNGAQSGGAAYNPALHQDGAIGRAFTVGLDYRY
jgi:iron complex outermembrane receptor protein